MSMALNCLFRDRLQFLDLTMLLGFVISIVASGILSCWKHDFCNAFAERISRFKFWK